jgi:hypothetical protein
MYFCGPRRRLFDCCHPFLQRSTDSVAWRCRTDWRDLDVVPHASTFDYRSSATYLPRRKGHRRSALDSCPRAPRHAGRRRHTGSHQGAIHVSCTNGAPPSPVLPNSALLLLFPRPALQSAKAAAGIEAALWGEGVITRRVYDLVHRRFLIALAPLGTVISQSEVRAVLDTDWNADVGIVLPPLPVLPAGGCAL